MATASWSPVRTGRLRISSLSAFAAPPFLAFAAALCYVQRGVTHTVAGTGVAQLNGLGHRVRKVDAATGIITTVAGAGMAGSSGDGGAATSGAVNAPTGLALDAQGSIYFADSLNHRLRTINAPALGPPVIRSTDPALISRATTHPFRWTASACR